MFIKCLASVALAASLLTGCSLSEEDYQQKGSEASCAWLFECVKEAKTLYGTEDECVTAMLDLMDASVTDDCTYDADQAQTCLDALEAADCESSGDFSADCDGVYTCDKAKE